jgi:hypothetical protein
MAVPKIRWYVKAQLGVLLLPAGLCVFGEAVIRKAFQPERGPWFWYGTLGLILINAGVGLMIDSGLQPAARGASNSWICQWARSPQVASTWSSCSAASAGVA